MRGLAFTPAQQRLTMAVADVTLTPAAFASESIDSPRIAASLAGRRRAAVLLPSVREGARQPRRGGRRGPPQRPPLGDVGAERSGAPERAHLIDGRATCNHNPGARS